MCFYLIRLRRHLKALCNTFVYLLSADAQLPPTPTLRLFFFFFFCLLRSFSPARASGIFHWSAQSTSGPGAGGRLLKISNNHGEHGASVHHRRGGSAVLGSTSLDHPSAAFSIRLLGTSERPVVRLHRRSQASSGIQRTSCLRWGSEHFDRNSSLRAGMDDSYIYKHLSALVAMHCVLFRCRNVAVLWVLLFR